ncbi:MAG: Gfo/Idh/MocA family oxidoreductase, partial [Planctomycetota bacterium]
MFDSNAVVVGTGFIGPVHVEALRRAGVGVRGILGSTPEKSAASAKTLGIPRPYSSLDEVLRDSDVDVVHLTSPNHLHFSQAERVLLAGKHVVCEKPLALNSDQSRSLVSLANTSNRIAAVCHNIRFYPLCHQAKAHVDSEQFGQLFHATGCYAQDWLLHSTDFNWRVDAKQSGPLRALADIGTHWLDLIQFVTSRRVTSVMADLHTVHQTRRLPDRGSTTFSRDSENADEGRDVPIDTEDFGSVLFHLNDGAKGQFH